MERNSKGQFVKGNRPWNLGKHYQPGGQNKTTRFKKGDLPSTMKPIGYIREGADGYIYIKISNVSRKKTGAPSWQTYQRYIWETHYQKKLSKNMIIIFLDGNKRNFSINNLAAVTREESLYINRHHLHFDNKDLSKTGMLIAKLAVKAKVKERSKAKTNGKAKEEKEVSN